jgi:hypothetical protein
VVVKCPTAIGSASPPLPSSLISRKLLKKQLGVFVVDGGQNGSNRVRLFVSVSSELSISPLVQGWVCELSRICDFNILFADQ